LIAGIGTKNRDQGRGFHELEGIKTPEIEKPG
jgi:hypothetical protein